MKHFALVTCLWVTTLMAGGDTTYRYDEAGRLAQVTFPQGKIIQYQYDARGNMLARKVTQLCYDPKALRDEFAQWPVNRNIQDFVGIVSCVAPKGQFPSP